MRHNQPMTNQKTSTRLLLLLAGLAAAFALSLGALAFRLWLTESADDASAGMAAFGDGLFFLAVFAVLSMVPTAAGLYLFRSSPGLWRALAALALLVAASGLAAIALFAAQRWRPEILANSAMGLAADLSVLRLLPAPLIIFALAVAGLIAPPSPARRTIWICLGVEALVGVAAVAFWG